MGQLVGLGIILVSTENIVDIRWVIQMVINSVMYQNHCINLSFCKFYD